MCGCSSSNSIIDLNKTITSISRINTSIYFDRYSKQGDYTKKYEFISKIGNGSFGKVRLYRDRKIQSMKYAIKTIKKNIFNIYSITNALKEIEILRSLDHPNIVKYFETYEDDLYLHIIMEYIPGDNLFKMLSNKQKINFSEKDINEIMLYLMKAILFLHHNGIIHRDIKPENILFSIKGEYSSLKLIDFGLSTNFNSKREKYSVGTPYYMSPEMLEGKYYFKSDMWSIGVILYMIVTGSYPFNGKNKNEIFKMIYEGNYNIQKLDEQNCSYQLKNLIKKSLIKDINKRISIEDALNCDWFKLFSSKKNDNLIISYDIIKALKNFQSHNILQKEILYYFAKISNDSEINKLKKAFSLIDKNNSGEIEYEEIRKIFKDLNINTNEDELKRIFNSLDFHNDGKVNYSEFIAATLSSIKFVIKERLSSAFQYFDIDNSGFITLDSVIKALIQNNITIDIEALKKIFKGKRSKMDFLEFTKIFYEKN